MTFIIKMTLTSDRASNRNVITNLWWWWAGRTCLVEAIRYVPTNYSNEATEGEQVIQNQVEWHWRQRRNG